MRILILNILLLIASSVQSQNIRIGLFHRHLLEAVSFHCTSGRYDIYGENELIGTLTPGEIILIRSMDGFIVIDRNGHEPAVFSQMEIRDFTLNSRCFIKPVNPMASSAPYTGNFSLLISQGFLNIINTMPLDTYISGVVEAEAGPGAPAEFFKVQAVLARTYAIRNFNSHASEGYHLCDDTHCQAFHGISDENPDIQTQVLATHNLILTDPYSRIIVTPYHSNSGGETQRASDLWPGEHPHLQAILDPFSENQRSASWKKTLSMAEWNEYLVSRGIELKGIPPENLLIRQNHRAKHFVLKNDTLSLHTIRQDLGLRSSFFSMRLEGDSLVIDGKGYGHGVGLSQEGAMEMARQGYSYTDILNYYFHMIKLLDLNDLPPSQVPAGFGN